MKLPPSVSILAVLLLGAVVASCSTGEPPAARRPNPYLSPSDWPILHHSSSQEASTSFAGPDGSDESRRRVDFLESIPGPAPVLFDSAGNPLVKSVDVFHQRHVFRKLEPESLEVLSTYELAVADPLDGLYSFLDFEDCWWNATGVTFHRICVGGEAMREDMTIDLPALHPGAFVEDDLVIGMNPLYRSPGLIDIAFVTSGMRSRHENNLLVKEVHGAKLGILRVNADRSTSLFTKVFDGEAITNNFAVDPEGGLTVLTNRHAAKLRLAAGGGGAEAIETVWSEPYDSGDPMEPFPCDDSIPDGICSILVIVQGVRFSDGSGTTPTLMGGDLQYVGFADGARPLRIVVLRSSDGSPVTVRDPVPFDDPGAQTENTFTAFGNRFAVDNNNPDGSGVAGYEITGSAGSEEVRLLWVNKDVFAPNNVPLVSGASNRVYTYRMKGPSAWSLGAEWFVTALDLSTGEIRWEQSIGTGILYNSVYAPLSLDHRKRIYIGLFGGLLRIGEASP